jgi:predicted nucleic acid-binding protein
LIFIDSSVWVDYFNGTQSAETDCLDSLLGTEPVGLGGQEMAIKSADNFRLLRKKGITVRKTIDVLIATFCISKNLPLLHSDKDFDSFQQHLKLDNAMEFVNLAQ